MCMYMCIYMYIYLYILYFFCIGNQARAHTGSAAKLQATQ